MAQIPGLPIDEPVTLPKAKPAIFGAVGETIAGLGQETEQIAQANMAFEGHLIYAHRQLQAKEAEIAIDKYMVQSYDDIRKASTVEDVQAAVEHAQDPSQIGPILKPYEKDPMLSQMVNLAWQQSQVHLQSEANNRKARIIVEGTHAADELNEEKTLQQAVGVSAIDGDMSKSQVFADRYEMGLRAGQHSGVYVPSVVDKKMEEWHEKYEADYIESRIGSSNLQTIQDTVNDLRLHPEKYSHLNKSQIENFANKGENAIVSAMSRQDEINAKMEEHKYWNQSPTGIPKMFTDVNGNFDGGKAEDYVAHLGLSPEGEKHLLGDIKTHDAASNFQLKGQATKLENEIVEAGNKHDYKKSAALLEQFKQFSDLHPELGEMFKGMSNYIDEKKSREMSLEIEGMRVQTEARALQRQLEQDQSFARFGQLGPDISKGKYSDTQLRLMTGGGLGKLRPDQMLPQQVEEAIRLSHSPDTDPQNKPYENSIWNDSALPTQAQGRIVTEFRQWLRAYPGATDDAKAAEVKRLTDPVHIEELNNRIDNILNDQKQKNQQTRPQKLPEYDRTMPGDDTGFVEPPRQQPKRRGVPDIGTIEDGYVFQGGNPNDRANWDKVAE